MTFENKVTLLILLIKLLVLVVAKNLEMSAVIDKKTRKFR
jgi:hypothetical protein